MATRIKYVAVEPYDMGQMVGVSVMMEDGSNASVLLEGKMLTKLHDAIEYAMDMQMCKTCPIVKQKHYKHSSKWGWDPETRLVTRKRGWKHG